MTYEEFCEKWGITVELMPTTRDDWDGGEINGRKTPEPSHFYYVLKRGDGRTIHDGKYSQGIGHAEAWAKKNKNCFMRYSTTRDFLNNPPMPGCYIRADADYWQDIRDEYAKAVCRGGKERSGPTGQKHPVLLPASDILMSLHMDAMGSDQPFEDWAVDLGYDGDSIKAKAIWEACNDIRRALNANLPSGALAELEECEEC